MLTKEKTKNIKFIFLTIWEGILGFISPVVIGIIFMLITGHGKGYGYDLREETSFSIMFGVFCLIIWLMISLPTFIRPIIKYYEQKKLVVLIPCFTYFLMFLLSVLIMGISNFLSFFGL